MKKIELIQFLKNLGLSDIEADLYLGLLERGPSSIMQLAKYTKKKRSTTHVNIENLIAKGIVTQTSKGSRRMVIAEPPEKLGTILEQKKWELEKLKKGLSEFVSEVSRESDTKDSSPVEVKYYEGKIGVRSIYQEVLKSRELRSYVNIQQIFKQFPENPQLFPEAPKKGHFSIWKEIIEESRRSKEYVNSNLPNYEVKFFPKKWNISLFDYMIFDNKVGIITGRDNIKGILIEDPNIYQNAKILFEMMWELLPQPD